MFRSHTLSLCIIVASALLVCAFSFPSPSTTKVTTVLIGDTSVNITIESRSGPREGLSFINVHENENTSVVACRAMQYYNGGSLTRIIHGHTRLVSFIYQGTTYTFDPNRIFTPIGVEATLKKYGPFSLGAAECVASFAKKLLNLYNFSSQSLIVALHNNGPGYSALSYMPGGPFEKDAAAIHLTPESDPSNFFFVTSSYQYGLLSDVSLGLNVVLQSNGVS